MGSSVEMALDKLAKGIMLEEPDREALREQRRNEVGNESPCPFCKIRRVRRTDYTRCNQCGVNWLDEENTFPVYLDQDPRISRHARYMAEVRAGSGPSKDGGAPFAGNGQSER